MTLLVIIGTGLLLAYANGANDNFKGVATLLGSHTTSYRRALIWATVTTALGSVTALALARGLLEAFRGKGLVPPEVVADPSFSMAVALAAGATVLHYDADYDRIAEITSQPTQWIAPRGSL